MATPTLLELLRQSQQQNALPGVGSTSTIPAPRTKDPGGAPFQSLESGSESRLFGTEDIGQPAPVKPFSMPFGQRAAMQGAQTEARRGLREIMAAGPEAQDIYQEELAREEKSGLVKPAFELLSIGNVTGAGLIDGFIKGDYSISDGLAQAATEFANALPGIDWTKGGWFGKKAYAPTYSDVLRNADAFNDNAVGRYTSAVLGFAMDIALDPTTYTGYGLGKLAAKASRAGGTVRALSELERYAGSKAKGLGRGVGRFGEMFMPNYRNRQWAQRGASEAAGIEAYLGNLRKVEAELQRDNISLKDRVTMLFSAMSPKEQTLVGVLADQPEKLNKAVQQYLVQNGMDPAGEEYYRIAEVVDGFRTEYMTRQEELIKLGLLEESEARAHYVMGANPLTALSGRNSDEIMKRLGVETMPTQKGYQPYYSPVLARNETFMKAKKFQTLEERILAGTPTETRASAQMLGYGMQVNRALATRRLLDSVISDPNIVKQINKLDLSKPSQMIHDLERDGYVLFDLKNVKGLTFEDLQRASMGEAETTAFMLPKPIAEDLIRANNTFADTSEFTRWMNNYRKMLGLWKGYALFSPGYHMRNLFSNGYLNYIGGVSGVKPYAEAMALQAGGTENLPSGVRGSVEAIIGKRSMGDVWRTLPTGEKLTGHDIMLHAQNGGVTNSGVMAKDFPLSAERELLTQFEVSSRKKMVRESPLTPYAQRFKDSVDASGTYASQPEMSDFLARFYDLQARKWSMSAGRPSSEWWKKASVNVTSGKESDLPKMAVAQGQAAPPRLFQTDDVSSSGEVFRRWTSEEPPIPHGTIESGLSDVFQRNSNPNEASFLSLARSNPLYRGLVSYGKKRVGGTFSYENLKTQAIEALSLGERNGNAHLWYRDFDREMEESVGKLNAPEASALFGVLSVDKAADQALAQTYTAMTVARQLMDAGQKLTYDSLRRAAKGTVIDGISAEQMHGIASLYENGVAPSQEIVSAIGYKLDTPNVARYENYFDNRLAKDLGVPVEDIRSSAWWYRRNARNLNYIDVDPQAGWRSAFDAGRPSADAPYSSSDALEALKGEMERTGHGIDSEFVRAAIGRDTGHTASNMNPVVSGIDGYQGPVSLSLDLGGLFASKGLSPDENLELQKKLFDRITTPSTSMAGAGKGMKIAALDDLAGALNFRHSATFRMKSTPNGPIPDFAVNIDANDPETVQQVAGILGDAFGTDAVYWHKARPLSAADMRKAEYAKTMEELGANEGLRFTSKSGRKFTPEQMTEIGQALKLRDGQELIFDLGENAFRLLNTMDELAPDELDGIIQQVGGLSFAKDLEGQSYLFVGGRYETSGLRAAVQGLGVDVSAGGTKPSDLQRRLYDKLYRPIAEAYADIAERSIDAGDDAAAAVATRIGDSTTDVLDHALKAPIDLEQKAQGGATKGVVSMFGDGKALITLLEQADATTIIHEMAHVFRRNIATKDESDAIKRAFGLKVGDNWPRYAEERYANEVTRYLLTQAAPDEGIRPVFDKIQAWMQDAWQLSRQALPNATFQPEPKRVLDRIFGVTIDPDAQKAMDPIAAAALEVTTKESKASKVNRYLGSNSPHLQVSRNLGVAMENNARLAHFLAKIEKTGNIAVSAASTRKYLIDYDELTPFERDVMRSVVPFYSWMRKNIPLQFQAMIENPGRYARVPKAINAIEEMSTEWQNVDTPDYFDDLHAVRLPIVMNGGPTWINPNMPFQDLNNLNWKDLLGTVTPFIKMYGEWFPKKGYSYFMDAPIEKYEGQVSSAFPWMRKKTMAQIQTMLPPVGKVARIAEKASEGELVPALTTEMLGIKLLNPSQQQVARSNAYMQREVVRRTKDRARALGIKVPDIQDTAQPKTRLRLRRHRSRGNQDTES